MRKPWRTNCASFSHFLTVNELLLLRSYARLFSRDKALKYSGSGLRRNLPPNNVMNIALFQHRKRELLLLAGLLLIFVAIRMPGLSLPYYQDEWKNAEMVRTHIVGGLSAHTPLMFGTLSAWLLYAVVRRRAGVVAALYATGLYAVSAYGVLASLMLDMDGTILPAFFLASVYAYDRFRDATSTSVSYAWLSVLALALVAGFLTKLSFVLVLGALVLDYLFEVRHRLTRGLLVRAAFAAAACAGIAVATIAGAPLFIPSFHESQTVVH